MATELMSVSEFRAKLLKVTQQLEKAPERYIITREGRPSAVLMSYDEFRGLMATLEVILDPEMVRGIDRGIHDKKARKVKSFEDVFGEPL